MAIKKIPCGGWLYDDESITFEDGVMKVIGGGDIPPEVTNAIETHGMGWTDEEEVGGFDIQWDGNTEGLESLWDGLLFKVDSNLHGIASAEDLIGSTVSAIGYGQEIHQDVTENDIQVEEDGLLSVFGNMVAVALSDVTIPVGEGIRISKGIWFLGGEEGDHISRFYKEASTEEVVHQIDQKYIPQGQGGVIIETATNTTVGSYQAPNPTVEQITTAYNAVVSAIPCTLTDALGQQHFVVNQADTIGDVISISILYYMEMIITYSVENDSVVITHYDIGNGG